MRTGFDSENEEPLRGGGIRASEISLTNLYPNRYAFSIKNEDSESGDILRISPKQEICDIIPISEDITTIFGLYNSAQ